MMDKYTTNKDAHVEAHALFVDGIVVVVIIIKFIVVEIIVIVVIVVVVVVERMIMAMSMGMRVRMRMRVRVRMGMAQWGRRWAIEMFEQDAVCLAEALELSGRVFIAGVLVWMGPECKLVVGARREDQRCFWNETRRAYLFVR